MTDELVEILSRWEPGGSQQDLAAAVLDLQLLDEPHVEDLGLDLGERQFDLRLRKRPLGTIKLEPVTATRFGYLRWYHSASPTWPRSTAPTA